MLADNINGDFIETGIWRGGACIFMRGILMAYAVTDRIIWAADSFEGVPVPTLKEDADFDITVFAPRDLRAQIRSTPEGRPLERVRMDWLNAALAEHNAFGD